MSAPGRMGRGPEVGRSAPALTGLAGRAGAGLPFAAAAGAGDFLAGGGLLLAFFRPAATTEKLTAPSAASCCRFETGSASALAAGAPLLRAGTAGFLAGGAGAALPFEKSEKAGFFATGAAFLLTVPVVLGGGATLTVPPFLTVPRITAFFFTVALGATFFTVAFGATFFTGAALPPTFTFIVPDVRGGGAFFVIVALPGLAA
mmetsp:Transcript_8548/g.16558  ORF Transcript_8548/g.16558 Transcript_8548/m.16558 type:complete len:203 (-) Transcript_8548:163-771(-)